MTLAVLDDMRVALARRREDVLGQARLVVRADQRERAGACEGQVEQRFVALALGDLRCRPLGPDGLADAVEGLAAGRIARHEIVPDRDDAGGIPAGRLHVHELDPLRRGSELVPEGLLACGQHGDEHRLVALDRCRHERQDGGQEATLAAVEDGVVAERFRPARREGGLCGRRIQQADLV